MTRMMNHAFRVSGLSCTEKGARFFVPLASAQDIAGAANRVSMIYVRSTGDTEAVRAAMVKKFPQYRIRSMAEYLSLMTSSSLPGLTPFIRSFVGLGVAISFLVILLTMYTLVLERRREIGILKALGASRLESCGLIVAEALVLVVLGVVFRTGGHVWDDGSLASHLAHSADPNPRRLDCAFYSGCDCRSFGGRGLSRRMRAAGTDPVEALAYE